ncbi:unnamed protein product [Nippostrongylus brasiliensis]|uniref:Uncharacterized protein n=1 Tax=Nippostrongylus brasiliensis TaxID=27835 RepID=A0A0N4XZ10_NIPBR|nr:unnamed protein product [Nippostrongylus brasiliensis]
MMEVGSGEKRRRRRRDKRGSDDSRDSKEGGSKDSRESRERSKEKGSKEGGSREPVYKEEFFYVPAPKEPATEYQNAYNIPYGGIVPVYPDALRRPQPWYR